MTFSQDCIDLVKASEGCQLRTYLDAVGVPTIGWGHTGKEVKEGLQWTLAQAEAQLAADLQIACEHMLVLVKVSLTQGQCDALTDFTFNMGAGNLKTSSLLRQLNAGNYDAVPQCLYRVDEDGGQHGWIYAGGKILPGLVTRRQKEIQLWEKA